VQIRRSATGFEVLAPAKINLFFEVLSQRSDGFHEVETLMAPIGLYDTLFLEDDPSGQVTLAARWALAYGKPAGIAGPNGAADQWEKLPEVEHNHAVRAIRLLARHAGIKRGAKLQLIKRIPAAAGLGGGSSDAAAALLAANLAWSLNWPVAQLWAVAAEIGSDVPFFLNSRTAVCRGKGEQIELVDRIGRLHLVIVKPPVGLSTATVYQACQVGNPPQRVEPVVEAFRKQDWKSLGPQAHNRLLEPARNLSSWIDKVLDQLAKENCPVVGMSGSGSACFAICNSAVQSRRVAAKLRNRHPGLGNVWSVSSV
jgi:4-diphosphocytidyl-2-C-methyl-D-erythritol kinase